MDLQRIEKALLLRVTRDTRRLLGPWRALDMRRLWRVMLHSLLVGALAGGVASLFFYALELGQFLLQGQLANYAPTRPAGEPPLFPEPTGPVRHWVLLCLPALGGLLCGLLTRFAPEASGAGGGAYVDAFHNRRGSIPGRVGVVKGLASLLTIGSGGSAGREGPTLQMCSAVGSVLSRRLKLDDHERRILIVAGAAAGMGAIFRCPLGAALFCVEVLYRDDFESDAIVPAILASVTGYSIFTTIFGQGHLFVTQTHPELAIATLPLYGLMAVGLSLFAAVFILMGDWTSRSIFGRLRFLPAWSMPAVGGALLGLLSLAIPQALGTGYGLVQDAIQGADWIVHSERAYWMLFGLAAAKMLATTLTIRSGGSGGEFGPSLVIGGLVGGGFGMLFHLWMPGLVSRPGDFALVGMGAFVGGVAHVPISSLILVCEMTGSYDLLVPLMVAEAVTFVLLRGLTLYPRQVPGRIDSPAHRHEITVDILESLKAGDVFERGARLPEVAPGAPLGAVLEAISAADHPGLLVRGSRDELLGLISLDAVRGSILDTGLGGLLVAADVMTRPEVVRAADDLHRVLHTFLVTGMSVLPVVDGEGAEQRVIGVITQLDVTRAYDAAVDARLSAAARLERRPV